MNVTPPRGWGGCKPQRELSGGGQGQRESRNALGELSGSPEFCLVRKASEAQAASLGALRGSDELAHEWEMAFLHAHGALGCLPAQCTTHALKGILFAYLD